jgi:hypothetical protein
MLANAAERAMQKERVRRWLWVVWPAFLVAGIAEAVFFTVFDPFDLHFFGAPLALSRQAIYTLGFFGFWGIGIGASALTLFFEHPPDGTGSPSDARERP